MMLGISRDDARKVLLHSEIRNTITEDGVVIPTLPDDDIYLCGWVDGDLIGCFVISDRGTVSVEVHVQVLPQFRTDYAEDFGHAVIEWTWTHTTAQKMVAEIPVIYPNVKDFAERMGFEIEGRNKASYLKNGTLHDTHYMGLRRGTV